MTQREASERCFATHLITTSGGVWYDSSVMVLETKLRLFASSVSTHAVTTSVTYTTRGNSKLS